MDRTLIVVALIAAGPPTLAAWVAARKASVAVDEIKHLHVEVNSRLSQLLEARGAQAGAEGELRGRVDAHRERNERNEPTRQERP